MNLSEAAQPLIARLQNPASLEAGLIRLGEVLHEENPSSHPSLQDYHHAMLLEEFRTISKSRGRKFTHSEGTHSLKINRTGGWFTRRRVTISYVSPEAFIDGYYDSKSDSIVDGKREIQSISMVIKPNTVWTRGRLEIYPDLTEISIENGHREEIQNVLDLRRTITEHNGKRTTVDRHTATFRNNY